MKATVTTKEFLEAIKTIEGSLNIKLGNILSNVCIKIKSYYIELVATDGNSLTMSKVIPQYNDTFNKDLIDKAFLFNVDSIKRAIDKSSKTIELEFNYTDDNNKSITIICDNSKATLPSETGVYPKYQQLMSYNDSYNEIKRSNNEIITIGITKKILLDILKSYDNKLDDILELEIPKDNANKYIGIRPFGNNNDKKFTMLMPVHLR